MSSRFSRRAQADLEAINRHTIEIWSQKQAIAYLDGLALTAKKLAREKSIVIARVLHERMRAELHICASGDRSL